MNSEKKGCTDVHIYTLIQEGRYQICACVCERCAVLGDKRVALDTAVVSRTTHLSPSTEHRPRTQAHICKAVRLAEANTAY